MLFPCLWLKQPLGDIDSCYIKQLIYSFVD